LPIVTDVDYSKYLLKHEKFQEFCRVGYNKHMQEDDQAQSNSGLEQSDDNSQALEQKDVSVSWTASEYIEHHKPTSWYMGLSIATGVAVALVFLLTRDIVSVVVITMMGILFGVFASRKPEVREYEISAEGISISGKLYPHDLFRSYSVHQEQGLRSLFLVPVKRFMPGITIYYPPDQEDSIMDALANYLPFEEGEPDAVDKFMSKIRF